MDHENKRHSVEVEVDDEHKYSTRHEETIAIEKGFAVKGDDSDGRVNWTWKHIVATISLCGIYVG